MLSRDPPEAGEAWRGVGPECERFLAPQVALNEEVGPSPAADRWLGREEVARLCKLS